MRASFTLLASAAMMAGSVAATYYSQNGAILGGFPNPSGDQLRQIEDRADGTPSNAPPRPSLNESSVPIFQLINYNENFEVAFFASLINNITADLPGYKLEPARKKEILEILDTVLAQEQLHAIDAATVLNHFQKFQPQPCSYFFPTVNVIEAFAFADRFTSLVLGTLQDGAQGLALNGDAGPIRDVSSVIGQEGQQSGFYRIILKKKPSEKPFLTTSVGPFLYSWVTRWVVPNSCPFSLEQIPLPIFPVLQTHVGAGIGYGLEVEAKNQVITFYATLSQQYTGDLWVTYLSGLLLPISKKAQNVRWEGAKVTVDAEFPFEEYLMYGLTVAALTTKEGFGSAGEVVAATLAAPGLIQVDDEVASFDDLKFL
ncbi:late sexual development protein [Podospora australis]|uniref:Late sexual development protein n=1 Tax=Podospora australis TaxID=1536484 RepID=A0AAN6WLF3_9PEZI|nr:late sexual development protein [Podospora australis]